MYPNQLASRSLIAALLCLFLAAAAPSQTVSGVISGTVADPTGAIVPGADVTVTNQGTGASRIATTNEAGVFVVVGLPPGNYKIAVAAQGFRRYERTGLVLTTGERLAVGTIQLALGATSETVTVSSDAAAIATETADTSNLISSSQLSDLTIKGRDIMNVIRLMPGVSQTGGSDYAGGMYGTFSPNISGARNIQNNVLLDGQSANDVDARNVLAGGVSVDAIAEVKVTSSGYMAEVGPNPGASIVLLTKSGTKDFHGSAYWYNRNDKYNAKDFFVNRSGARKEKYRMNTVGIAFGGPVAIPGVFNSNRNKLFFFYSGEGWGTYIPTGRLIYTVPTPLEREGDFSQSLDPTGRLMAVIDPLTGRPFPNNVLPASRINAQGKALLNILPQPNQLNRSLTGGAYNYEIWNYTDTPRQGHVLKVDYMPTAKDVITLRPKMWQADNKYPINSMFVSGVPLAASHYYYTHRDIQLNWTRTISATLLNEFTGGFWGGKERGFPDPPSSFDPIRRSKRGITLGQIYTGTNPYDLIPSMSWSGINNPPNNGIEFRTPIDCGDESLELSNKLSWTRGAHTVRAGFFLQKVWNSEGLRGNNFNGSFNFGNDANNPGNTNHPFATALLGYFTSYTEGTNKNRGLGTTILLEWFGQDVYKITRKLTLTYGVRFGWVTPYHLRKGQAGANWQASFYDSGRSPRLYWPAIVDGRRIAQDRVTGATGPAVLIGAFVPGVGSPANGMVTDVDINNGKFPSGFRDNVGLQVQPRFGFAYDLFGSGKTAIRGGFGVAKQMLETTGSYMYTMGLNPPYIYTPVMYYGNLDTFRNSTGVLFAGGVDSFERDYELGVVYNYSLGIQHDVGHGLSLDLSYVGNVGRHLLQTKNLNAMPYGTRFLAAKQDPTSPGRALPDAFLRPYPEFGTINSRLTTGTSSYNSMQVAINRRFSTAFNVGIAYTWSKAMGIGDNAGSLNPFVPDKQWLWGPLAFDQTQMFSANYTWNMPKLSGVLPNPVVKQVFDGWQLSGITVFASGMPAGVSMGTTGGYDFSGGDAGVRADVVGNPNASNPTFLQWFNTAAFALPARGTYGNASRVSFRGPGINSWDLTLMKNFRIKEKANFRFRAEFYNAFNHTQYNGVNASALFSSAGVQTNTLFGQVTSTRTPRVIQFGLNFSF